MMGGAFSEGGNVTPAAEFNIYVDPEAAARVLACGAPITMIPLDCTHQALTTGSRLERLRSIEAASREQRPELERLRAVEAVAQEQALELQRLRTVDAAAQEQTLELERLRIVEAAAAKQAQALAKAIVDGESGHEQVAKLKSTLKAVKAELDRQRMLEASIKEQLNVSNRLVRQQALVVQRFEREMQSVRTEIASARAETAEYKAAYNEACNLLIPIRLRRPLPDFVKRPMRLVKRALGSAVSIRA